MKRVSHTVLSLLCLALTCCGGGRESPPLPAPQAPAPPPSVESVTAPRQRDLSPLLSPASLNARAPESFSVTLETTKGTIVIRVQRGWAPHGADRLYNLVRSGFLDGCSFYRVVDDTVAEFGIHGERRVNQAWTHARIPDDPVLESNLAGTVSFAKTGVPDSRNTRLFINLSDNSNLDRRGYAPVGQVTAGLAVARALYSGYGEHAPRGRGPDRATLMKEGKTYLKRGFPALDSIERASIIK